VQVLRGGVYLARNQRKPHNGKQESDHDPSNHWSNFLSWSPTPMCQRLRWRGSSQVNQRRSAQFMLVFTNGSDRSEASPSRYGNHIISRGGEP
jgi:hypothetical protein